MKKTRNWLLAFVVTAAAGAVVLQNRAGPQVLVVPPSPTIPPSPTYEGCSFMWSNQNDPVLTEKVDAAIKALDSTASANAHLFGEDCVYADGHSTFSAMETDFYVRSFFDAFNNEEAFGTWMKQVMDVIIQIPPDEVQGPMPGFVEFLSVKGEVATSVVRVPIQQYKDEASGKTGAELFNLFVQN